MSERLSHRAIRQREIDRSEGKIASTKRHEMRALASGSLYYGGDNMYDSPLDGRHLILTFEDTFWDVLPPEYEEKGLRRYIEDVLAPKRGSAIGLELGGPGSRLFRGFSSGFFASSAGICLVDSRHDSDKRLDEENNHSILEGDILTEEGKQEVATWTGGKKIDLLIMRMAGPRHTLPKEPFYMAKQAAFWYPYVSEVGLIFAQLPFAFDHTIEKWVADVNAESDALEAKTDKRRYLDGANLRLRKFPGAPEELPLLDTRTVIKQQKELNNYKGTNRTF